MNKDTLEQRIADYFDDLLDDNEAKAVEQAIAKEPALVAKVAQQRARLYHPYAVAPPARDMPQRIVARYYDRPLWRVARYAAVFAAGVLSALFVRGTLADEMPVVHAPREPTTVIDAPANPEIKADVVVMHRRRIR